MRRTALGGPSTETVPSRRFTTMRPPETPFIRDWRSFSSASQNERPPCSSAGVGAPPFVPASRPVALAVCTDG